MIRIPYIILTAVIVPLLAASSCTSRNGKVHDILLEADSLVNDFPSKALGRIAYIDSINPRMNRQQQAMLTLIRTKARYKLFYPISQDTSIYYAASYYRKHGPVYRYAESMMMQGAVLYEQGRYSEALYAYKEAEQIMSGIDDKTQTGLLNTRIGELYSSSYVNSSEAVNRFRKALACFDQTSDIRRSMSAHLALARALLPDSTKEAKRHVMEGIALAMTEEDTTITLIGNELLCYIYDIDKEYDKLAATAEDIIRDYGRSITTVGRKQTYNNILQQCIKAYSVQGETGKAKTVAGLIYSDVLWEYNYHLIQLYLAESERDWETSFKHQKAAWEIADSLKDAGYRRMLLQSEKLYDSNRTQMENILLRQRLINRTFISIIAVVCIAAIAIILIQKNHQLKNRNSKIYSDNLSLTKRIEDNTIKGEYISIMEDMIRLTDKLMDTHYRYGSTPGIDDKVTEILDRHFHNNAGDKEKAYGTILRLCNAMYPDLLSGITANYPSIKPKDLTIIAGMACGLSTGTLCSIRNISERSLNVDKSRIAKILGMRITDYIKTHSALSQ